MLEQMDARTQTIEDSMPPSLNAEIPLSENALTVLRKRYLLRGADGEPVETPAQMFWRVARVVAEPDAEYGGDPGTTARRFYDLLSSFRFMPNSPTFTGAGTPLGQLAACFVLPIRDDMGRDPAGI
ncbi:MAG: ribonucleotide reductase N-terminal alpha domain-containing protein, partial [Anaerolineae bacterium]